MSHELYFKSGRSNKDAVFKKEQRNTCLKKAVSSAFLPAIIQAEMTRETLPRHLSVRKPASHHLFPGSAFPVFCSFSQSPFVLLSLSLLFSLFSNWDDKISDCHSYSCLLLIDKTISNPSWAPYASDALLSQSQSLSTERGSISLFELSATATAFISELLG